MFRAIARMRATHHWEPYRFVNCDTEIGGKWRNSMEVARVDLRWLWPSF